MGNFTVNKDKNGNVWGSSFATPACRCAFVSLVTPKLQKKFKEGDPDTCKFEMTLLLDPTDKTHAAWCEQTKKYVNAMKEEFNDGRDTQIGDVKIGKDGNKLNKEDRYPFYENRIVIQTRVPEKFKPTCYGANMEVIYNSVIQGGMVVKAVITPLLTNTGISYRLGKVRLVSDDGTRFGNVVNEAAMNALLADDDDTTEQLADTVEEVVEEAPVKAAPAVVAKKPAAKGAKEKAVDLL